MTLSGQSIELHVEALRTSDHVMAEVQDKQGISPDQQLLVFAGKIVLAAKCCKSE